MSDKTNSNGLMGLVAFVAVFCIGVSLVLGKLPFGGIAGAFAQVAQILAYLITSMVAFNYVARKKRWLYWAIWIVSVVLISLFLAISENFLINE